MHDLLFAFLFLWGKVSNSSINATMNKSPDDCCTAVTEYTSPTCATSVSSCLSQKSTGSKVHFAESVNIRPIEHVLDLNGEECFQRWYQPEDYSAIKRKLVPLIRKLARGETRTKDCFRGLELKTPRGQKLRTKRKLAGLQAVLQTQEYTKATDRGRHDPETIAHKYIAATSEAKEYAYMAGVSDEKQVQLIREKERLKLLLAAVDEGEKGVVMCPRRSISDLTSGSPLRTSLKTRSSGTACPPPSVLALSFSM